MRCEICLERQCTNLMCTPCQKSFDTYKRIDDGTTHSLIVWVARRSRFFERKRQRAVVEDWRENVIKAPVTITTSQKSPEEVRARIAAFKDALEPPRIIAVTGLGLNALQTERAMRQCERRMWTKNSAETRQCVLPRDHTGKHEYGKPQLQGKRA